MSKKSLISNVYLDNISQLRLVFGNVFKEHHLHGYDKSEISIISRTCILHSLVIQRLAHNLVKKMQFLVLLDQ